MSRKVLIGFLIISLSAPTHSKVTGIAARAVNSNWGGAAINTAVGVGLAWGSWKVCPGGASSDNGGSSQAGSQSTTTASQSTTTASQSTTTASGSSGFNMMPSFGSCCGVGSWYCVPASVLLSVGSALSYVQAFANTMAAIQSDETKQDAMDFNSLNGNDRIRFPDLLLPDGTEISGSELGKNLQQLSDEMKKKGYGLDIKNKKVTLPNGRSIDTAMLNDPAALAAALGVPEEAAAEAVEKMKQISEEAAKKLADKYQISFANNGGGGTVGGGSSTNKEGMGFDLSALFNKRKPASIGPSPVSGLKKNVNGDMVGVAQDNIFQMIKKRYKELSLADFFVK